jgi:hypothetical protein
MYNLVIFTSETFSVCNFSKLNVLIEFYTIELSWF